MFIFPRSHGWHSEIYPIMLEVQTSLHGNVPFQRMWSIIRLCFLCNCVLVIKSFPIRSSSVAWGVRNLLAVGQGGVVDAAAGQGGVVDANSRTWWCGGCYRPSYCYLYSQATAWAEVWAHAPSFTSFTPVVNHCGLLCLMALCYFFESFAIFVAADVYFWWEKFMQQEALAIPEHSCLCFSFLQMAHLRNLANFDSSIIPYYIFGNKWHSVEQCAGSFSLPLWIIIHYHSFIFKFVSSHSHFLSADNVLAIFLSVTPSACRRLTTM